MKSVWIMAVVLLGAGCKQSEKPQTPSQQSETSPERIEDKITACTTEVKDCGDGHYVSRDPGQSCQFKTCPTEAASPAPEKK